MRRTPALVLVALLAGCSTAPDKPVARPSTSVPVVSAPPPSTSSSPSRTAGPRWTPRPGTTWQWQLNGSVDVSVDAQVFDVDGFTTSAATVQELHRRGRKVICYVEVGSAEDFRPDYRKWPAEVLGRTNGWPGERWVDIRDPEKLRGVLGARFDMCRDKGFDGVEPDLMDGYVNDTGFPLTATHQLAFNKWVAKLAHDRGLSVGLKNDVEQIPQLVDHFEFTVNEECAAYDECAGLKPFVDAGKAVFHAEYDESPASYCAESTSLKLSSVRKKRELDAARTPC